jgi:hypothetical protein
MARARLSTDRGREYTLVDFLDSAEFVLRDDDGDVRLFEESSFRERVEIRCDECGSWSTDVFPQGGSRWVCILCVAP